MGSDTGIILPRRGRLVRPRPIEIPCLEFVDTDGSAKVDHGSDASIDNLAEFTWMGWIHPTASETFKLIWDKGPPTLATWSVDTELNMEVRRTTHDNLTISNFWVLNEWWWVAVSYDFNAASGQRIKLYRGRYDPWEDARFMGQGGTGTGAQQDDSGTNLTVGQNKRGKYANFQVVTRACALEELVEQQHGMFPIDDSVICSTYGILGPGGTQIDESDHGNDGTVLGTSAIVPAIGLTLPYRPAVHRVNTAAAPQTVTPTPATADWTAPAAGVALAVTVAPAPAVASWSAPAVAGVALGPVTVSPAPATASWSAPATTVTLGGITVAPTAAAASWSAPAFTIFQGQTVIATPAAAAWSAPPVTLSLGAITVAPAAAVAAWSAPSVTVASSFTVAATPAAATWSAPAIAAVTLGGITVSPGVAVATWSAPVFVIVGGVTVFRIRATPIIRPAIRATPKVAPAIRATPKIGWSE